MRHSRIWLVIAFIVCVVGLSCKREPEQAKEPEQIPAGKEGAMKLTSPAFEHNEMIPRKFTPGGDDVNPPLAIEGVPDGARSLVLIMDDPDAPSGTWVHWVVYDIPVTSRIEEDSVPGKQGTNDFRRKTYGGPSPPSGTHRYFFKLYALDQMLNLDEGKTKLEIEKAMQGHILAQAELIGLCKR